ncbi:hypothetical protein D0T53_09380 [Dysgonomonas sp. 216]|uniref:hypothetical protein n=1 Tax=Dysgonomonas sp. 216 TaxID=2302934 RepID=UPI0013CF8530|nr:hypothetical protein [Dysgonomonas sp. 216]NDW19124.1 hypothetical protein [Dysgonomonas sp. 216]
MRKLFTFLLSATLLALGNLGVLDAQDTYKKYHINETFDGLDVLPTGWNYYTGNGTSVWGKNGGFALANDAMKFSNSASNGRGAEVTFPIIQENSIFEEGDFANVVIEFDWNCVEATTVWAGNNGNSMHVSLLGSKSVIGADSASMYYDAVWSIYVLGDQSFYYWNQDLGPFDDELGVYTQPAFISGGSKSSYAWLGRKGSGYEATQLNHAGNKIDMEFAKPKTYHIKSVMDFENKIVKSITITDTEDDANTITIENKPFISSAVEDLARLSLMNTRDGGSSQTHESYIDNFEIYVEKEYLGKAPVYINYLDQDGGIAKAQRVELDQPVSTSYSLLSSDKVSFVENGNYYAYDKDATGEESVVVKYVEEGTTEINVIFKKTPATTGTYVWSGAAGNVWSELDDNFNVGGTDLAYQSGNAVEFSNGASLFKEIEANQTIQMGDANVVISAEGYSIGGTGKLTGTGYIEVNASTTLSVVNELTSGVEVNEGTLTIANVEAGKSFLVADGVTLDMQQGAYFNKPITSLGGALTIIPTSNFEYASEITGVKVLNYVLNQRGNVATGAINRTAIFNNIFTDGTLNVTSTLGDTTYFVLGVNSRDADYSTVKVNLGENIFLGTSDMNGKNIRLGELSGPASSEFVGPRIRTTHYHIGSLNTNAEFAGAIKSFGLDSWDNTQAFNINKVGKGTWTLSGTSDKYYDGTVTVVDGTLIVNGVLGAVEPMAETGPAGAEKTHMPIEVLVADTATIKGNGTINGTFNMYGTMEGNLTVANIGMSGTSRIKIGVHGTTADKITVLDQGLGMTIIEGATLEIVETVKPEAGAQFQIIDAVYIEPAWDDEADDYAVNGFMNFVVPTGAEYTFDANTGILTCVKAGTGIEDADYNKVEVSREYYDLSGKLVTSDFSGFAVVKIKYEDGSVSVRKVIKK